MKRFFPINKTLYSIAFGTHTKTAEPIEMLFGMMSELGPRNSGVTISEGEGATFWGKHVPDKPNTPSNSDLDWYMQRFTPGADT